METYEYNNEVKNGPKAGKVLFKAERKPLENHFNDKNHGKHKVCPVE